MARSERIMRRAAPEPVERRAVVALGADELEEALFERLAGRAAGAQLGERALRDEPALVDDADVIAEPLDDLEDVRREEHRAAALARSARAGP